VAAGQAGITRLGGDSPGNFKIGDLEFPGCVPISEKRRTGEYQAKSGIWKFLKFFTNPRKTEKFIFRRFPRVLPSASSLLRISRAYLEISSFF